jgi:hypothetical protein
MGKVFICIICILLLFICVVCDDNKSIDTKPIPSPIPENNLPTNTYDSLILIAKVDKSFKEILSTETGGDNSGTCGDDFILCWSFSSKYEFVPGKNQNFFDLKITTTGTKDGEVEKTVVPVDENKTYVFDGKEYKATK